MIRKLKFIIPIIALCLLLGTGRANAQWTVIDPSNIAQSIVNSSKSLVQESTTATNMVRNFQETVKIYQQAKKYYTHCNRSTTLSATPARCSRPC